MGSLAAPGASTVAARPARQAHKRADGEGSLYYDATAGLWRGELMVGRRPDGKRDVRKVSAKNQADARKKLDALKGDRAKGIIVEPRRLTVRALLDQYLADATARGLRPKTLFFYQQAGDHYLAPGLGTVKVQELRPEHVRRWATDLAAKGLSSTTIRNTRAVLHAALQFALRQELVARNVVDVVKPPKRKRPALRPPTPDEMDRLMEVAEREHDRLAALWTVAAYGGCRPGELRALQWPDVDWDTGIITIQRNVTKVPRQAAVTGAPKSDSGRRSFRIAPDAIAALRAHRAKQNEERLLLGPDYTDRGLIFCAATGAPYHERTVVRYFKRALARADLPGEIRFYDMRHGNATAMLLAGVSSKAAAERLGHSSTQLFNDTYAHMLAEIDADAAAKLQSVIRRRRQGAS